MFVAAASKSFFFGCLDCSLTSCKRVETGMDVFDFEAIFKRAVLKQGGSEAASHCHPSIQTCGLCVNSCVTLCWFFSVESTEMCKHNVSVKLKCCFRKNSEFMVKPLQCTKKQN